MAGSEYAPKGGPADKTPPLITQLLLPGTLWRGLAHGKSGAMVDLGDIGIISHASKGIECAVFKANERLLLPYVPDTHWVLDRHSTIRIHDGQGNIKMSLAPTSANEAGVVADEIERHSTN